jgi:hypothetical protein
MPCPICADCEGTYPGPARSGIALKEQTVPFRSDKRLYVNADKSKVVDEDSPEAAYLLVGAGGSVSDEDAKKYGLKKQAKAEEPEAKVEAKVEAAPESEPEAEDEAESKAHDAPPENKAKTMGGRK